MVCGWPKKQLQSGIFAYWGVKTVGSHHDRSFSNLYESLLKQVKEKPHQFAFTYLVDGEKKEENISYQELDSRARAIASTLQEITNPGDRVVMLYPPGLDFIATLYGCFYAGVVAVPLYPPQPGQLRQTLPKFVTMAQDAQAKIILCNQLVYSKRAFLKMMAGKLRAYQWINTNKIPQEVGSTWKEPETHQEDIALLMYTSGSTGNPKGVMLTHGNLLHHIAEDSEITKDLGMELGKDLTNERGVSWVPPYSIAGLVESILFPVYLGGNIVLMSPLDFLSKPSRWLEALTRYRGAVSGGPNFAYDLCVERIPFGERGSLDLSNWIFAMNGTEPIRPATLERFMDAFGPCGFRPESWAPTYGITEGGLMITLGWHHKPPGIFTMNNGYGASSEKKILVGCGDLRRGNKTLAVNPETLCECSPGEIGEIWLSGPTVAKGYWNKPEETQKTFRGFLADTGEGPFLRTGDLGFIQKNEVILTGRLKEMIIIRGLNYYPVDIEQTVEKAHPQIPKGRGAAFSVDVGDEERLVVVQEVGSLKRSEVEEVISSIRKAISSNHGLQAHAVALIKWDTIPRTPTLKVQRLICRKQFLNGKLKIVGEHFLAEGMVKQNKNVTTPDIVKRSSLLKENKRKRRKLLESYFRVQISEITGVLSTDLDAKTFLSNLGLDSLMATQLATRLREDLEVDIPLQTIFSSSMAGLIGEVEQALHFEPVPRKSAIHRVPRDEELPLSFSQERLWFLDQLEPNSPAYNIPTAVRVKGNLDLTILENCFSQIVRRHESLRTTFGSKDGIPYQIIGPPWPFLFEKVDLRGYQKEAQERELAELSQEEAAKPFSINQGPLLRGVFFQLAPRESVVLLTMHHIISDGWSLGVLLNEVAILYESMAKGQPSPLEDLPLQYPDFSHWQRKWFKGEALQKEINYWKQKLGDGPTPLELPTDYPRPLLPSFKGKNYSFKLSRSLLDSIKELSQREGVTPYMTFLAAFQILLSRYSSQKDISVGTPIANRNHAQMEPLIGFFVNNLVMRANLSGEPSFLDFLKQVREVALGAYGHQDLPFEKLVMELNPHRDLSRSPLFQVMFAFQNFPMETIEGMGISLEPLPPSSGVAKFDLTLFLEESSEGIKGTFEYKTALFKEETIARMVGHFETLLLGIISNPGEKISKLPILTKLEEHQILVEWNNNQKEFPKDKRVHQLFEAQVERSPGKIALVFEEQGLTYRDLNQRANQLAHYLYKRGIGPDVLVGIFLERSLEMVIAILGILKAGGAYVPLDPDYPKDRLGFMLQDSKVGIILTQEGLLDLLPESVGECFCLDGDLERLAKENKENPANRATSENLAYVIYTSGSTGQPKGVAIEHRQLTNYLFGNIEHMAIPKGLSFANVSTLSADLGNTPIFDALITGGTIHVLPREKLSDPEAMADYFSQNSIDVLKMVPSHLRSLLAFSRAKEILPNVILILGGEPLSWDLVDIIKTLAPNCIIYNEYGPTETTVGVITHGIGKNYLKEYFSQSVPIGKPYSNIQAYILDSDLGPVPAGVPGELFIGGLNLARGYLYRPDLTQEKFISNPFDHEGGSRLYKTGDLARYLPDGNMEFLGRIDHQVKIRGFRVELGEIEAILGQHPQVSEVVTLAREDEPGLKRLVAYLVTGMEKRPGVEELKVLLKEKLPEYMIPAHFLFLEKLPLTANGKIDRQALPPPDKFRPVFEKDYVAPKTPTEITVTGIISQILKIDNVGINDNFFELGGHSLMAAQAITQFNQSLGIPIPLKILFETNTIEALCHVIDDFLNGKSIEQSLKIQQVDLFSEAKLDPEIFPAQPYFPPKEPPQKVLLTGASGYLGAYLLYELFKETESTVYCIVRARDHEEGVEKIRNNLKKYALWEERFYPRIVPIPSDLTQPYFGLSRSDFHNLSEEIQGIYHCAAWVTYIRPYKVLKSTNVLGTQEILKFACTGRVKPVHYISTIGVFEPGQYPNGIHDDASIDPSVNLRTGYEQSKWVAEKMVTAARSRGIPVNLYRSGRVTGHSQSGICNQDDLVFLLIAGCIQLRSFPDINVPIDFTPVDYISRGIIAISRDPLSLNQTFNMVNPKRVLTGDIISWLQNMGYSLTRKPFTEWKEELINLSQNNGNHTLAQLVPFFLEITEDQISGENFLSPNTLKFLNKHSIFCPSIDQNLLRRYISNLSEKGLLDLN